MACPKKAVEELLFIKPQELFIGRQGTQIVHNNYVKLFLQFDYWFLLSDLVEDRHVDDVIALFCFFFILKSTPCCHSPVQYILNRSQKMPQCGKSITDTLAQSLMACVPLICFYHI